MSYANSQGKERRPLDKRTTEIRMDALKTKIPRQTARLFPGAPLWVCAVIGLGLQASPLTVLSQTYFITDELKVPLRSGASRENRIKTFLESGAAVVSTDNPEESSEWVEVRYNDRIGWLLREHLKTTPPAQLQLVTAQEKLKKLETSEDLNKQALEEARSQIATLEESLQRTQLALTETQHKVADLQSFTADTVAVNERNTALTEKLSLMEVREQQLSMENHDLRKSQRHQGMLHGALAVIAGALLAVIIPRLTRKKQNSGWV